MRELNSSAFSKPQEARLVDALRMAAQPLVSLVAEKDGELAEVLQSAPRRAQ